jgi:hypothetical protein
MDDLIRDRRAGCQPRRFGCAVMTSSSSPM